MRKSLKYRLQFRFVLLSFAALLILQSLIVGVTLWRNYRQITLKADRLITTIISNPESSEVADARYFTVTYDLSNRTLETDTSHTALISRSQATDYAKSVLADKTDKGYIENYRYLAHRGKNGISIVFLSRTVALESFRNSTVSLLGISGIGIMLMIAVLAAVSGKVVSPLVKNRQKQKEFITSASHELKTPLTVINADAQLLETEIGENEWLSDILKQTEQMTDMTHRLVFLARAEEQNEQTVKIEFPISDIAKEVAASYQAVARSSGKIYAEKIKPNVSFCGDEKAIRELMTALLDNAFKYGTENGTVTVSLTAVGHAVCFSVENTVDKVRAADISHFTERFYRSDTSDKVKGFGIGLSVAQAVCETHRGRLTVELVEENNIKISALLKG